MVPPNPALDAPRPGSPPRWRHGFTLAIAVLGVLFAWVPGLGILLSLAALAMGLWGRRHRVRLRSSTWAVGFAIFGLILGLSFSALYLFLLPPDPSAEEKAAWERFDRLFEPPVQPVPDDGAPVAP
jgi:hypothetical protein